MESKLHFSGTLINCSIFFFVRLCSGEDIRSSQITCRRHAGTQPLGIARGQPWQEVAWKSTPRLACHPSPGSSPGPWCPRATLGVGSRSKMQLSLQHPAWMPRTRTQPPPSDQTGRLLVKLLRLAGEAFPKQHFFFFPFCLGQRKSAFIPWTFIFL